MDESNTVVSAYTLYRHLQQYCSHPSTNRLSITIKMVSTPCSLIFGFHCPMFRRFSYKTTCVCETQIPLFWTDRQMDNSKTMSPRSIATEA